jgi:hypothetical protein
MHFQLRVHLESELDMAVLHTRSQAQKFGCARACYRGGTPMPFAPPTLSIPLETAGQHSENYHSIAHADLNHECIKISIYGGR